MPAIVSGSIPAGAADIDAFGEAARFALQRLDGAARHSFGQAVGNLREVLAQFPRTGLKSGG